MPKQSFFDEFTKGLGDAVADIRQKVVEEPYFGRAVTERGEGEAPQWPQAREEEQAFGSSTHTREMETQHERAQDVDLES
jgi:hypothetical protein